MIWVQLKRNYTENTQAADQIDVISLENVCIFFYLIKSVEKKAINTSLDTDIYIYMWMLVYEFLLYVIMKPTHLLENKCLVFDEWCY